jgi:hypothetical protein
VQTDVHHLLLSAGARRRRGDHRLGQARADDSARKSNGLGDGRGCSSAL